MNLITYGCGSHFDIEKFTPIQNIEWIKPTGGLWASPINSEWSWFDWCKENKFGRDLSRSFEFEIEGNIYIIDSYYDALNMPLLTSELFTYRNQYPDFEKLLEMGYDAIWLTQTGEMMTRPFELGQLSLYGWDCESVLIMNPNCVLQDCTQSHSQTKAAV